MREGEETAGHWDAELRGTLVRAWPVGVVLASLVVVGLSPSPLPQWFEGQDKLHHVVGLLVFAVTLRAAFSRLSWRGFWIACVVASGSIELAQALLPARTPSMEDLGASLAGAALGWWVWALFED